MLKAILAATAAVSLVGCASVMNDVTHGVRVDTKTTTGQVVAGAECVASNDYGSTPLKSGTVQAIRRSSKDLEIKCNTPGQPTAIGRAISRANAALAGNIIVGGVIGAVIDHNRGTAYTYPTWIEMIFGETLVFDRTAEKEGTPLKGAVAGTPAAVSTIGVSNAQSHQCQQQLAGAICSKQ